MKLCRPVEPLGSLGIFGRLSCIFTWMLNSTLFVTIICTKEAKRGSDTDPHEHNSCECFRNAVLSKSVIRFYRMHLKHGPKIVVNGTAADEPSPHKIRFITKNIPKMNPETKNAVNKTFVFHRSPPNVL